MYHSVVEESLAEEQRRRGHHQPPPTEPSLDHSVSSCLDQVLQALHLEVHQNSVNVYEMAGFSFVGEIWEG